jgi:sec-independent protein translocase protein TatA
MGFSIWHLLLFALVVLLLFGSSKLKNLGKDLGGAIKDFKDSLHADAQDQSPETPVLKDVHSIDLNKEKSVK